MKILLTLALLTGAACYADGKAVFDRHDFEIATLEPDAGAREPSTPLLMSLPPIEGFAPNVNVTIQTFDQGIDQYIELSRKQYQAMNLTVVREIKTEKGEWFIEYSGSFQNMSLHWYSRAVFDGGRVYLVTATSPEKAWEALSAKLRGVVNSFALRP
jgi:hypothetical protein